MTLGELVGVLNEDYGTMIVSVIDFVSESDVETNKASMIVPFYKDKDVARFKVEHEEYECRGIPFDFAVLEVEVY